MFKGFIKYSTDLIKVQRFELIMLRLIFCLTLIDGISELIIKK